MQPIIPGYRLQQELHRSARSLVVRGVRERDQLPVVIKTIHKDYPEPEELARLRREHRILSGLDVPGVVKVFGLEQWENNLALVMEDVPAAPLDGQLPAGRALPLTEFFRLAVAVTRVLSQLHPAIGHLDLNPRNLLWHSDTETLRVVGFSGAIEAAVAQPETPAPLVGALAFISPEQTGRMNRTVDHRSDLYSLGVLFYRLLTGQLPFEASDPVAWVHLHISHQPAPPDALNPEVPAVLGALTMKLLAKNPEERYQSAQGLLRDLLACQREWQSTGAIAPFELARHAVKAQFQVPQRLYGRGREAGVIREACRAAAQSHTTLVVVSGPAGIGKSALVHEAVRNSLDAPRWFFEGKFDQFQRQRPYAAVSQALTGLVRHLLTKPEAQLARWRTRLTETLGPNGRIAVDLVPELARIIGPGAPVAALAPTEEQNRFLSTIQSLIGLFARPEHPLVLFLDDLQWSDGPTLRLMRSLLESPDGHALLLIGAFRDDELHEGHPLRVTLADVARTRTVEPLALAPLDEEVLNRLVADTLHADADSTRALSRVIHRQSAGNPFFAAELLRTLHQDGLFTFDHAEGAWRWDLERVQRAQISDDIVAFMVQRIQRLAPETQTQLRLAACLGDTFDLRLLAELTGLTLAGATAALWPAITAGLVAPLGVERLVAAGAPDPLENGTLDVRCQFLHDRVRQAAYALTPEDERKSVHLRIGRLLLAQEGPEPCEARTSEIAQQLNEGRELLTTDTERLALARMNLTAGQRAKEAAAYRAAFQCTAIALELMGESAWTRDYALALEVHRLHASSAYLAGETEAAERCYAALLGRATSAIEKAEVYAMRAAQYTFSNHMDRAVEEGLKALAELGIRLSATPGTAVVARELVSAKLALGRRSATDLDAAPPVTDPRVRLAMKILEGFLVPAYLTGNANLFAATVLKQATLSFRHGNCEESVSAFGGYAVLVAGLGDLKGAYAFGQLALRLSDRYQVVDSRCRTLVLYALFAHSWSQPWSTLEGWFKDGIEAGLRSGDFVFMAYGCGFIHLWDPRLDLETAIAEGRKYLAMIKQTTYENAFHAASVAQQFWVNLRGDTTGPLSLSDAGFDEAACLDRMTVTNYVSGTGIYHLFKLQVACFRRDAAMAWAELLEADRVIQALAGSPYMVDYCVYGFQAAAQMAGGEHQVPAKRRMRRFYRQMRGWAAHCPENFQHHLRLMEAELARVQGRNHQAPMLYEMAVAAARQSGFVRDEARANELAGHFFRARGLDKVAITYLRDARDGYRRWGARSKVRELEGLLQTFSRTSQADPSAFGTALLPPFNLGLVPQLVESGKLDLATIWKATQAISSEATFERLVGKLMQIVKESAGAQTGFLVLAESLDGQEPDPGAHRFLVQAESTESGSARLLQGEPLEDHQALPVSLIRYVIRSQESVVLQDAAQQGAYTKDPYIESRQPKSVLALPIVNQGHLVGVLYLENNLLTDAFTPERLSVLQILAGQAAVSLQNVRAAERAAYLEAERTIKDTYARELERRVEERTAELTEANARLRELDRLKTNFLNVVSHELRTPLTMIKGYAEFLEDAASGSLSEDQLEYVQQIQAGTTQLRRLVDDLLDFARVEAGSFRLVSAPLELRLPITKAIEGLAPLLRDQQLTVVTEYPAEPLAVNGDAGRLSQVLLNLVGNAIKYTPEGGTITIAVTAQADEWRVAVRDTGVGIAPEHIPLLFEKFFQVDSSLTRQRGGVGLGLSIAQSIVEAHGGRMGVESEPGQGSTFWFTIPRSAAAGAAAGAESGEPQAASGIG